MRSLVTFLILIISSNAMAQYSMQWYATYDNPHPSYVDEGIDLVEDDSGNVYVTGTSFQIEPTDDWRYDLATIKYNSNGDSIWVRRYDASVFNEIEERAKAIGIDGQNNIYVTGTSYGQNVQVTTIKYDSRGNQIWVKDYHDTLFTNNYYITEMIVDSLGNVYLACSNEGIKRISEVVKYNSDGNIEWVGRYFRGVNDVNYLSSLALDDNGNTYLTGYTQDSGSTDKDFMTVKFNQNGILEWAVRTDQESEDISYSIKNDNAGSIYIAGYSSVGNSTFFKLIKYNSTGSQEWIETKTGWFGLDHVYDHKKKRMIIPDGKGNVYVNYNTYSNMYNGDIVTAKYSANGDLQWQNIYNYSEGQMNGYEESIDFKTDKSGNVYVTGISRFDTTSNSFVILKYNTEGALLNSIRNVNQFPEIFLPVSMVVSDNGNISVTGSAIRNYSFNVPDYLTVVYSNSTGIQPVSNSVPAEFKLHQNYPNPFNPVTKIRFDIPSDVKGQTSNVKLAIFDVLGKEVATLVNEKLSAGIYATDFDASNFASGIYFYKLETGEFSNTKRMILLK